MKKIETFIEPMAWDTTRRALARLGVWGTVRDVKTFGRKPAQRAVYRGTEYELDTAAELELSVVVPEEQLEATVAALQGASAALLISTVETIERGSARIQRPSAAVERVAAMPRLVAALAR